MVTDAYSVREGLGEAAAFYRSHPLLLNFSYFAIVIMRYHVCHAPGFSIVVFFLWHGAILSC